MNFWVFNKWRGVCWVDDDGCLLLVFWIELFKMMRLIVGGNVDIKSVGDRKVEC